jgi:hypothetical protein
VGPRSGLAQSCSCGGPGATLSPLLSSKSSSVRSLSCSPSDATTALSRAVLLVSALSRTRSQRRRGWCLGCEAQWRAFVKPVGRKRDRPRWPTPRRCDVSAGRVVSEQALVYSLYGGRRRGTEFLAQQAPEPLVDPQALGDVALSLEGLAALSVWFEKLLDAIELELPGPPDPEGPGGTSRFPPTPPLPRTRSPGRQSPRSSR